ncbi:AzlC family ABC transporter permease [Pseudonocardia pini]|uniref:AzlC family ABC transporter permease n=1 Tax=Pseudonocardia pini TaxID=2758030 RepID=UPI0015F0C957|nr:AzlC family ABC transporter permease [Pseudonocardia pini]
MSLLQRRLRIDPAAVRDIAPMLLGMAPFGLLIGLTLGTHTVGAAAGLTSAALYYGGTAHLAALQLITAGAAPPAILAGVIAINARLLLYGAALAPRFADQPRWFRWLGAATVVDQTYALARPAGDPVGFRRHWLTMSATLAVGWLAGHVVGLVAGPVLPAWLPLGIAAPAMLVGLLVPHLKRRTGQTAAVIGGTVAALASPLPPGIGTLVGAAVGIVAATLVGRRR